MLRRVPQLLESALLIRRSRGAAIVAVLSSNIALKDAVVLDTLERACGTECADLALGDGLVSALDAHIDLSRFEVGRSARVGIHVLGGTIELHDGVVFDNPIGANVYQSDFDTAALSDRVEYRNNERNLDVQELRFPGLQIP